MCVLKQAMMNKGLCSGKCDRHPQNIVVDVTESNVLALYRNGSTFCNDKRNCTNCSEFGNPRRCKLTQEFTVAA
jgi:hypothetical protein